MLSSAYFFSPISRESTAAHERRLAPPAFILFGDGVRNLRCIGTVIPASPVSISKRRETRRRGPYKSAFLRRQTPSTAPPGSFSPPPPAPSPSSHRDGGQTGTPIPPANAPAVAPGLTATRHLELQPAQWPCMAARCFSVPRKATNEPYGKRTSHSKELPLLPAFFSSSSSGAVGLVSIRR